MLFAIKNLTRVAIQLDFNIIRNEEYPYIKNIDFAFQKCTVINFMHDIQ